LQIAECNSHKDGDDLGDCVGLREGTASLAIIDQQDSKIRNAATPSEIEVFSTTRTHQWNIEVERIRVGTVPEPEGAAILLVAASTLTVGRRMKFGRINGGVSMTNGHLRNSRSVTALPRLPAC
jgi:hypothetical protein